ncbi:MAG: serine--tRNA ligase [Spirochaetota bacterium]
MIDLRELASRRDEIQQNITDRNMNIDVDEVIRLQSERSELIQRTEALRQQRNAHAKKMKGKLDDATREQLINEGKELKKQIAVSEAALEDITRSYEALASRIPNYAHPEAPRGKEETDNKELRRWGDIPQFSFKPKDHVELSQELDLVDFDTAARVSGPKFYYLRNDAVLLELAIERYALEKLRNHGFTLTITPDIAKEEIVEGIGFNPRGEESNIYNLEGTGTCLVGTAEITLGGYYAGQILSKENLPIYLSGLSHCFRREAGAAGKFSKGLFRVHQFSKVEMFVYCLPEQSQKIHEQLLAIEEEIFQELAIPYRVVDTCTGDLGAPAYRKYDLEAWMPGRGEQGDWGEVTSASNCTDYQARRLQTRYREDDGNLRHVHLLNGTAVAVSRVLVALLENNQQADGSVGIPKVLQPYMGKKRITRG